MSLIDVHNLSFAYRSEPILRELTFSVQSGDFLAILGPNGSGKTTLLNLLAGLLTPQSGQIRVQDKPIQDYRRVRLAGVMAMVRQSTTPAFGFTVRETVLMSRYLPTGKLFETPHDAHLAERAMEMTDTLRFAERPLTALSGGERQRVFIARALAQQTPVLLLDEPTSHLDLKHQIRIFELLKDLRQNENKTIVLVSHDINLIQHYADSFLLMAADGRTACRRDAKGLDTTTIESFFEVQVAQGTIAGRRVVVPTGISRTH